MMTESMWLVAILSGRMNRSPAFRWVGWNTAHTTTCLKISLTCVEMLSFVCLAGARRKHQRERGGFLRADPPVCIERSSDVFLASPVLHLPQSADLASATSQDRSSLTHSPILTHPGCLQMNYEPMTSCLKPFLVEALSVVTGDMMDVELFVKTFTK